MKNKKHPIDYRIITNGCKYVIQANYPFKFFKWSWDRWYDLGRNVYSSFIVKEYSSKEEAENMIKQYKAVDAATHDWTPV